MGISRLLHQGPLIRQRMRETIEDRIPADYSTDDVAQQERLSAYGARAVEQEAEAEYFSRGVGRHGLSAIFQEVKG